MASSTRAILESEERRDKALQRLDHEMEDGMARFAAQLEQQSNALINEAQNLTTRLENRIGKATEEDIRLSWSEAPLLAKGEIVQRSLLDRLNELVQEQLSEVDSLLADERRRLTDLVSSKRDHERQNAEQEIMVIQEERDGKADRLRQEMEDELMELKSLRERQLLSENHYRELSERWGNVFEADMGAEAIRKIVAAHGPGPDGQGDAPRDQEHALQAAPQEGRQAVARGRVLPQVGQPAGVDDPDRAAGYPAGPAPNGAA